MNLFQRLLKTMKKLALIIFLAVFSSCDRSTPPFSDSFYVIWNDEGHESFNLKNMQFQREYLTSDTTIELSISIDQLRSIYEILVKNKVTQLKSEDFSDQCPSSMLPSFTSRLTIGYSDRKAEFVWDGSYNDCKDEGSKWDTFNLDNALSEIREIIYSLPEVAELKKSDIVYM